jgi:hypothetical protein
MAPNPSIYRRALAGKPSSEKLTFNYASTGQINNRDTGEGASMSITLTGTLTLGTPGYDSLGWSDWRDEDHGWNNYNGGYDWYFTWVNTGEGYPNIPDWVYVQNPEFVPQEGYQYHAHIDWDNHEHWMDHYQTWDYRWYTTQGSFSGKLIAMWSGGTAPETFSVSLTPWKVEKSLRQGNQYMGDGTSRHEHWDIYWQNPEDGEVHVASADNDNVGWGGGFNYYSESLQVYTNGKLSAKKINLQGRRDFGQNKFWQWQDQDPENKKYSIGIGGSGEFGPYSFNFPTKN